MVTMSEWEKVSKSFLKREARRMSDEELTALGKKLYNPETIDMLPEGEQ